MTRTVIKVGLDIDDLVSNAGRARGAISALTKEMKKAEKEGRFDDYVKLAWERDRLQVRNTGFDRDIKNFANNPRFQTQTSNGTVFKVDAEYAGLIKNQIDAMKRLTAEYEEAVRNGDIDTARGISPQIEKQQAEFHKIVEDANQPTGAKAVQNAVKAVGFNQIAGAFNDALSRVVNSLDRSGIVNQYGSGDILGGRISEERRQADLWGGLFQTGLTVAGTVIGAFAGNPLAGAAIGSAGGQALNTAVHGPANQESTEAAYAGLWQNQSGQAMELAAIMGSANDIRGAFKTAADAATQFGYSAEEGMDAMKQAAQQGLGGEEARAVIDQSFDYERRTGADRGTLMGISTMSARYGAGDALGTGWAGMQASKMGSGQYNEYLRAMQRVMEDGISKGFSKSAKEVAGDLTFLKEISGGSELWKGERGQQRLSQMNAGLESATGLASASDILAFRGAQNVLKNMGEEDWRKITDLDNNGVSDIKRSNSYIDAMVLMERGLNADTFGEIMKLNNNAEGGERAGVIERMRQQFNLNYTNSAMLYDQWAMRSDYGTKAMSSKDIQELIDTFAKAPPPAESPELDAAKVTESIKNWWTQTGETYWNNQLPKIYQELAKAIHQYNNETGSNVPVPPMPETFPAASKQGNAGDAPLSALEAIATNPSSTGDDIRPVQNAAIEAQINEGKRQAEIERMLMKTGMPWDKDRATLFTGDANPFTKNDDEKSYDRFMAYRKELPEVFSEAVDIFGTLTQEQIKSLNESGKINSAIPDVMTDGTGKSLLHEIKGLRDDLNNVTVRTEEIP